MSTKNIHEKIYEIRGQKVMLDFDLAQLYEVETRVFNQAVKRNGNRFPEDFMFRLTSEEWENHMKNWGSSQVVMTSGGADEHCTCKGLYRAETNSDKTDLNFRATTRDQGSARGT